MNEIEIIKQLFVASSAKSEITVVLNDGSSVTGIVQLFDGEKIYIANTEIPLCLITDIQTNSGDYTESKYFLQTEQGKSFGNYKAAFVRVITFSGLEYEGYVFDQRDGKIVLITSTEKKVISDKDITDIVVINNKTEDSEVLVSEDSEYIVTEFEQAVLKADKEKTEYYLNNPEILATEGYTEEEVASMSKAINTPLPWNDDDINKRYNQARRLYSYEKNRGNLALKLFREFLLGERLPYKYRVKAINTIIEILCDRKDREIVTLYEDNKELIIENYTLCFSIVKAFIAIGLLAEAREVIDETGDEADFSELLITLCFYEKYPKYDFSELKGIDAFSSQINFKEIKCLMALPERSALVQLLSYYSKTGRHETFFALLELFMPYVKNDARIVEIVGDCLKKDNEGKYLKAYLPEFPVLWVNKELAVKLLSTSEYSNDANAKLSRLINQCNRTINYAQPNELETSIIKGNFQLFDVLRGNDGILLSMGYSPEEIERIKNFDLDTVKYGDKTAFGRLVLFEGNRNGVAETVISSDFLRYPQTVACQLFPLLLSEGNGELIYELYNYSAFITKKLVSQKIVYLKSLLLIGEKKEYFEQIKDVWFLLGLDSEMLIEGRNLALEYGRKDLADVMNMRVQYGSFNEFELALISGNVPKVRALAFDADILLAAGYTSEEIKLIQESTRIRTDFTSSDYNTIANRLYLFQKNKNCSAEFYYKLALKDEPLAAIGLFSILINEDRCQELCALYEEHLCNNPGGTVPSNKEAYLNALFKTKQYDKYVDYWKNNEVGITVNPLYPLISMIAIHEKFESIKRVLDEQISVSEEELPIVKELISFVLFSSEYYKEYRTELYSYITYIFNLVFPYFSEEELSDLKPCIEKNMDDIWEQPSGNGLRALNNIVLNLTEIQAWIQCLLEMHPDKKLQTKIIKNAVALFNRSDKEYFAYIRSVLISQKESGIAIPEELSEYLLPRFENEDEKLEWLDKRIGMPTSIPDEFEFDLFCKYTDGTDNDRLYKYLRAISSEKLAFSKKYLEKAISKLQYCIISDEDHIADLLLSIENQMKYGFLSAEDLLILYEAYLKIKKNDYAYMTDLALHDRFQMSDEQMQRVNEIRKAFPEESKFSLFSIVKDILDSNSVELIDHFCGAWANYLTISEDEASALIEIKDYFSMPTKWSEQSLDSLAKHFICNSSFLMYWKLLSIYFKDDSINIRCNVLYHIALAEKASVERILLETSNLGLSKQTVEIVERIVSTASCEEFNRYLDTIEFIIEKYPNWFSDRNRALRIIIAMFRNERIRSELLTWTNATTVGISIALSGGVEREYFNLFKVFFEVELETVNERFLCALLLERPELAELVDCSYAIFQHSSNNIPYKKLLDSLLSGKSSFEFTEDEKDILTIVRNNKTDSIDESLLYKYYTVAVSQDKVSIATKVLDRIENCYPELPVISDVKKYQVISDGASDDDVLNIYLSEFKLLKMLGKTGRIEKVILNMIPAELYLKAHKYDVESVIKYGAAISDNHTSDKVRNRVDLYKSLSDVFESDKYPGLFEIFLKCSFIRNWKELINYNISDQSINEIIKSDTTVKSLMGKKSYEVLKSTIISVLESDANDINVIERSDAVMAAAGGIKRSKNYLRRIQAMPDDHKSILRRVFSVRIESKTLRDSGVVGSVILDIPGNELVGFLIGMLEGRNLAAIFDNALCLRTLMIMPAERANAIAEIYATFFYQGIDNVFLRYMASQSSKGFVDTSSDNPFEESVDHCSESRKYYQISKNKIESTDQPVSKLMRKTYELNKSAYLYDAVVYDCEKDILSIKPTKLDYLSVLTYLFNRRTVSEMRKYVWKIEVAYLEPMYALLLEFLEQYQGVYDIVEQFDDDEWKHVLFQILYRDLLIASYEDRKLRNQIQKEITIDDIYFLGRFTPVNDTQVPNFIERMKELRAFIDEVLDYMVFNGIEHPRTTVNDEKFDKTLEKYLNVGKTAKKNEDIVKSEPEERTSVYDLVSVEYIERLLKDTDGIVPVQKLKRNPDYNDCIGALKYYAEMKVQSQNVQDILQVRDIIRWTLIRKMDRDGYDRELFNYLLALIYEEDSFSKMQWEEISGYLQIYFEKIGDIFQLSRIVENDITSLRNISKISNDHIKFLRTEDIKSWEVIIESLSIISGIDFTRMSETEQINRLSGCRRKLSINSEKKSSVFNQINTEVLRILTSYIMKLRHNPELTIDVIGENEDGTQLITWENAGGKGTLYAVISNIGGDDCQKVSLSSSINMARIRKVSINSIYSGEKVPFTETFDANDLVDGRVTWNVELSYYDAEKKRNITITHESKADIQIGGEPLNLGVISTGNPARGKNFVGRKRELTLLRNHYSDIEQLPSMLIRGLKRSGKSSIIIQFAEEIRKQNKIIVSMVDGQSIGGEIRRAFIDKVIDGIYSNYRGDSNYSEVLEGQFEFFRDKWKDRGDNSNWISDLDNFYYELSCMFGKKILIIMDEMESVFYNYRFESVDQEEMLYSALRALIQKSDNYVSFIFCGSDTLLTSCLEQRRESQMFQTLQYIEVGRMNYIDIQEIYRQQSEKYDIEFTRDSVDAIWQYTHGLVWYAKLLGYLVINNILANDSTIRREVNRADIVTAVQMLINGEIGTDKYDLVDASLSSPRSAIVHAMASIMPDYNKELSVDEICAALSIMKMSGYTNPRNGEPIGDIDEKSVQRDIDFLEKMQFVDANASRTKFRFTSELYRLFFREDRRLHLFEERGDE